jgi:hypothetical protein
MNYDIDASCGGKRRGCCIIPLPNTSTDIDADSSSERRLFLVFGLSDGRPSSWTVVSIPAAEAADFMGKATW